MTIYMEGAVAHLHGNMTDSEMTQDNIESLAASLDQIESEGGNNILIDCKKVSAVDVNGLQLLDVWMQCARFMGVEPELVNLSASLQLAVQKI